VKEKSLYGTIESFLTKKGYLVFQDFPIGRWNPKRVDLIGVRITSEEIVSVEVKTRNLRRAVEQASYRLFFSDFVYLAFPHHYAVHVARTYSRLLRNYGFGLMGVDGSVKIFLLPSRSTVLSEGFKTHIINLIYEKLGRM